MLIWLKFGARYYDRSSMPDVDLGKWCTHWIRQFSARSDCGPRFQFPPPSGGYGMKTGVGDGVDLGWKIAATLQGWGGPELIASYESERRPVHGALSDEAMANYAIYVAPPSPEIEDETPAGEAIRAKVGDPPRTGQPAQSVVA